MKSIRASERAVILQPATGGRPPLLPLVHVTPAVTTWLVYVGSDLFSHFRLAPSHVLPLGVHQRDGTLSLLKI